MSQGRKEIPIFNNGSEDIDWYIYNQGHGKIGRGWGEEKMSHMVVVRMCDQGDIKKGIYDNCWGFCGCRASEL